MSEPTNEPSASANQDAVANAVDAQQLVTELAAARKRIDDLARAYQASEADREAFKQRLARERESMLDIERGGIAVALLEAIDELDLCLSNAPESPLATGVKLIRDSLLKRALTMGVEAVDLNGKRFDPNLAEATDMEITAHQAEDGQVSATIRRCYQLKGRVIRPGRVKVAKYVTPASA